MSQPTKSRTGAKTYMVSDVSDSGVVTYWIPESRVVETAADAFTVEIPPMGSYHAISVGVPVIPVLMKDKELVVLLTPRAFEEVFPILSMITETHRVLKELEACVQERLNSQSVSVEDGGKFLKLLALENKIRISKFILDLRLGGVKNSFTG